MSNQECETMCGWVTIAADTEIFLFGIGGKPDRCGVSIRPVDNVLPQAIYHWA
jgi:hypothetical protein